MSDTANDLDRTQNPACEDVAEGRDSEKRPCKQRTMPILGDVVLVVEDYQTLSNGTNKEGRRCDHGHPAKDRDPTLD